MIVCYTQIFSNSTIGYKTNDEDNITYVSVPENNLVETLSTLIYKLKETNIQMFGNSVFCEKYADDVKKMCYKNYGLNPEEIRIEVK